MGEVYKDIFETSDGVLNTEGKGQKTPWICDTRTNEVLYKRTHNPVYISGLNPSKLIDGKLVSK